MSFYPPGAHIAGRYEVASRPLLGGMGLVYFCNDLEGDRAVALKTFRPELLPDRAARDRFLREGTHWVELRAHPHIVHCYQVVHTDPEVYLVLELVAKEEGRVDASLRSWLIPCHPLPAWTALLFALQVARGMAHATATIPGFVHRDLKPENLLIGADKLPCGINRLRITDLGLATVLEAAGQQQEVVEPGHTVEDALRHTRLTRGIVGTPLYMAPEQWRGEPVTLATDVYALGCILAEMLAGRRVVEGSSLAALERAHCAGQVRPLPTGVPTAAREVVAGCMAREPKARHGAWAEVEAAVAAAYEAVTGRPPPTPELSPALGRAERVAAGWSYSEIGASYLDLGQAETALAYFERARAAGATEAERRLEGAGLNNLGLACLNLGDVRRAIGYCEQALMIDREVGGRCGEGATLGNLGLAYARLGDVRKAIGYYEQRLEIAREIGDRRGEGNVLANLGSAYRHLGDARRAIDYHEQALLISRESGDRRSEGANLGNLGLAYARLGDVRRAIDYHQQRLDIAHKIGDRRGEGHALGDLGGAYLHLGDARRAIGCLQQALAISHELGDRRSEGTDLGDLGSAYFRLGDTFRAIDYYEQYYTVARTIEDRQGEGNALSNLGSAYAALGDAYRAVDYYEQALAIKRVIGDRRGEGNTLGSLANAHADLGHMRRAVGYYEQANVIFEEIGDVMNAANTHLNLAESLVQQRRHAEALPHAQRAAHVFAQIGHAQYAAMGQKLLAKIQAALR